MNKPVFARNLTRLALVAMLPMLLAGCLTEEARDKIKAREPEIVEGAQKAQTPGDKLDYNPLVVTDKVWLGNRSMRLRRGLPLPANLENPRAVTLVSGTAMPLSEIATFISQQTGVSVRLVDGAEKVSGGPLGAAAANAPVGTSAERDSDGGMQVSYQGPLSGLLDSVSSYFGVSWRYDGGAIIISRFETRTFTVEALATTAAFSDGITGGNQVSAASGTNSSGSVSTVTGTLDQTNKLDGKIDYWAEFQESIKSILAGVGTVKTSPSSGTVTVITTPEIMRTVSQYIDQENQRNTRQVAITMELFTLTLSKNEDIGADVNVIYNDVAGGWPRFGFNGPPSGVTDGGNGVGVSVISPTSKWSGSTGFIKALSTLGDISRVARIPLTTLNNRPATRRIGRDIAYLAKVSTSNSSGSDIQSETLEPGMVQEGFSLQVTPRILGDGRIIVQFSLSVIDLVGELRSFESGSSKIELPETSSRVFVQQALLNNGDSLVLAGFDQDRQSANNSGFGNPFNILFGGNISGSDSRELLFLTLTPREIDIPRRQMISGGRGLN